MSTLRERLRNPRVYLLTLALICAAVGVDALREPNEQIVSRMYITAVHGYQHGGSPLLSRYVRCRYSPTCSRYSVEAVQRYGLGRGLALTASRLWRCRGSVPLGTPDPVP